MVKCNSNKYYLIAFIWFFGVFGSQLYIFPSGTIQPSHFFLILAMGVSTLQIKSIKRIDSSILKYLFIFIVYSTTINMVWSIIEEDLVFLYSSAFWFFGFGVLISATLHLNNKNISYLLKLSVFISILFLYFLWALGLGRYKFSPRYNALFNDPNQMAFWILCALSTYIFLSSKKKKYLLLSLVLISGFLIFTTISRSALLGFSFLLIGVAFRFQRFDIKVSLSRRVTYLIVGIVVFLLALFYLGSTEAYTVIIDRFSSTDFGSQAEVRGYSRLSLYPEYLFFGSGQGLDGRFNPRDQEIHSNWVALLFYYGIIGLALFLCFLYKIFIKLDLDEKFVFLGPLIYGFSTYGLRSPIFWVFIAAAMYLANHRSKIV